MHGVTISMEKLEYQRLKVVLADLKEMAATVDRNEDSIFEDERSLAESCKREIVDTLLNLEL